MAVSPGDKLGPYEILAPIGAGGMGEVYKARDTRLDRTVAIKVLPEHIAKRDDLRARFEREARAVASLKHPHICTLYDIGSQDGAGYMVMEFMDGETLAGRIAKGALPLDQALKFATQIADALDRAHRAGVTHRDVKPQNIMLTRDGAKVLDFGLAKSTPKVGPNDETLTAVLTTEGAVMGTPQYMAPEQFAGAEADGRCDVWAFGAVLYEMVAGRKAFRGANYQSLVGAILATDPAPMSVKPFTPAWLERIVKRCLAKDPEDRYQSMRDVALDLQHPTPEATPMSAATASRRWLWPLISVALASLLLVGSLLFYRERPAAPEAARFQILPPARYGLSGTPVVSPDGRQVAFVAGDQNNRRAIWVRPLSSVEAKQVTSLDEDASMVFWSADSHNLVYAAGDKLKKLVVGTGASQVLCNSPGGVFTDGAWLPNGVIVFGSGQSADQSAGIWKVPDSGGVPVALPVRQAALGENTYAFGFSALPDGEHFLYARNTARVGGATSVYIGSAAGAAVAQQVPLLAASSQAIYVPSPEDRNRGHLMFLRDDTLYAQSFDAAKATLSGEAIPIESHVGSGIGRGEGGGNLGGLFSASSTGVLLLRPGSASRQELTWLDRQGNHGEVLDASGFSEIDLSPDGKKLAAARDGDIWIVDLERKLTSRFTLDGAGNRAPVWSRDGSRIAFTSNSGSIFVKPAGGGPQELIYKPDQQPYQQAAPNDFGAADDSLVFTAMGNGAVDATMVVAGGIKVDLMSLPLATGFKPKPPVRTLAQTQYPEGQARVSPDGRWVAYVSLEGGRNEAYLRPLPEGDTRILISKGLGVEVRWRRDGRELYYRSGERMMAVQLEPGATPRPSEPKELFKAPIVGAGAFNRNPSYVVSADGQRFLAILAPAASASDAMTVVMNWQAGLKN